MFVEAAERCLLTGLVSNPHETYPAVRDIDASEFERDDHKLIFRILKNIIEAGSLPDEATTLAALEEHGKPIPWCVDTFKDIWLGANFEVQNIPEYVRILMDGSRQRKAIASLQWGMEEAKKTPLNGKTKEHLKGIADGLMALAESIRGQEEDDDTDLPTFPEGVLNDEWARWVDLHSETTEAPRCYHAASYLMALSVAVNRHAWVTCGTRLYPQWYSLLVGATAERKTTVIDRVEDILAKLDKDAIKFGGFGSGEGVMKYLAEHKQDRPNTLICLSEAGKMLRKVLRGKQREAAGGGVSILCDLYDAANRSIDNPVSSGNTKVISPFVQVFGACTPKIAATLFNEEALEEGLANRFTFFVGKSDARLDLPPLPDHDRLESSVRHILHAAAAAKDVGEFHFSPEARELNVAWYKQHRKSMSEANKRLQGHMLKFALCHAISSLHSRIEVEDVSKAIAMADFFHKSASYLQSNWLGSERGRVENRILSTLARGPMPRRKLQLALGGSCGSAEMFRDALSNLLRQRAVKENDRSEIVRV